MLAAFDGDWEAFKAIVPNETLCADGELVRVAVRGGYATQAGRADAHELLQTSNGLAAAIDPELQRRDVQQWRHVDG